MRIICYGVRPNEIPYFEQLNKYDFELKLVPDFLTAENATEAKNTDAVLLRGNCLANKENLELFASYGIKYVFTRTVGINHIDLEAADKLGLQVARVPNYSPYAVAELAMTLGMQLFRHINLVLANTSKADFRVLPDYFSREIHSSTVGIIGAGKIGVTEAKLYRGMGTKVLAYDPFPNKQAEEFVEFKELDEVLATSDIISMHIPYFPGQNDNFINADFLKKMKKNAVLVNTSRSEIADTQAIISAIKTGELAGYAADVFPDEEDIMGHNFASLQDLPNKETAELTSLYPKVILTPHIGSYTEPALKDMISISYENFHQSLTTGSNQNIVHAK
ncbi:2-hydroxyacid dehydrogenase [Lactobacillus kalixensis]|uniref:Lactate dehydrogenase n=1 Tax=Lactobacillus kalixensis DSM 16043 TaxID=1423763 RepID=A0A0R1UIP4_9LACO|nr:2-hydroxyacid dehydrogenase [Lactobacillus kalixensis]KRL90578.1 lactate dehydrogenase [Lactobacillus kalixensis DSM 16043]